MVHESIELRPRSTLQHRGQLATFRFEHPGRVPVRGRSRHRSACARTARTIRETNSAYITRPEPTLMSGSSMRLDVLPCGGHPLPRLRAAADGANGQVGAHAGDQDCRLRAALVHRANRRTTAARPDAKKPSSSKVQVENHIRSPIARELDVGSSGLETPGYLKLSLALQQLSQQIIGVVPQPAEAPERSPGPSSELVGAVL